MAARELGRATQLWDAVAASRDGFRYMRVAYQRRRRSRQEPHPRSIALADIRNYVFCFGGEFGYELLSWLPYLNHVAHELKIPLRTASRPGSVPFYTFSSEHYEVPFSWRPDMHGNAESQTAMLDRFGSAAICASNVNPKRGEGNRLIVGGIEWEHRRIHSRLTSANYRPLHLRTTRATFVPSGARVAVINNKNFDNWGNTDPQLREAFGPDDLRSLREVLERLGYFVVYHRFDEPVPEERFPLNDAEIFADSGALDMREIYAVESDPNERTKRQLELYSRASLAICPQGGNSYLPAMHQVPTLVLTKSPRIVEYQDLERIYEVRIDVYSTVRAIVAALSSGQVHT